MMDKIELQSVDIAHNQEALERERKLNDMRSSFEAGSASPHSQAQILDLQARNDVLTTDVASLNDKLKKARAFIKNQDALFRAEHDKKLSTGFTQQSQDYESKIGALKNELSVAKVGPAAPGAGAWGGAITVLTEAQRAFYRQPLPPRAAAHAGGVARPGCARRARSRWRRGPAAPGRPARARDVVARAPAQAPGRRPVRQVTPRADRGGARRHFYAPALREVRLQWEISRLCILFFL